jgi:uncharacterized protein YceK
MGLNYLRKSPGGYVLISLIIILFLVLSLPAVAEADSTLSMTAKAGFNGYVRTGEPVSFTVKIDNPGPEIRGDLQVSCNQFGSRVIYSRQVVLPQGACKSFNIYASDDQGQSFNLRLMAKDKELVSSRVKVTRLPPQEMMVGVLSDNLEALNHLGAVKLPGNAQRVTVINLKGEDIPSNPIMLESMDVLVLADFSSHNLRPKQLSSMQSWVEGGGLLVTCGGANWQKTLNSLPETLLPVQVSGSVQVSSLAELEKWTGQQLPAGKNIILSQGQTTRGTTLVANGQSPVLVASKIGHGNVYYLACDPGSSPFDNWSGNDSLWLNIFTHSDPHQVISAANARTMMMDQRRHEIGWALRSIPASDLPSRGLLAAVLLLYILILGPGAYLLLKKFDRRELGWIVIPLTAILLFSATYFVGFKGKGRDVFTRVISIVQIEPEFDYARVNSYIGAFAPTHREFSVKLTGNLLVDILPMDFYRDGPGIDNENLPVLATVKQGADTRVSFGDLSRWSTRSIATRSSIYQPGNIDAKLYTQGNKITGTVTNNTRQTLSDCIIFSRYGYQKLNKLEPGETTQVDFMLYLSMQNRPSYYRLFESYPINYPRGFNPFRAQDNSKMRIMEMYFNRGQGQDNEKLMFIGWSEEEIKGVLDSNGMGKVYPSTAWLSPLPVNILQGDKVSIPPGIINGRIIEVKANHCEQNLQGVQFGGGPVTFQLDLPYEPGSLQVERLNLLAPADNFQSARWIKMELYQWSTGSWKEVKYQLMGNSIEDWQKYLSEKGSLRVRISPSGADGWVHLQGVTLTMEANYQNRGQQPSLTTSEGR